MRAFLPLALLLALACAGGSGGPPTDTAPVANDQDVRGVYALTWADTFTVTLDIGGAVQEQTVHGDEIVTFNAPDGSPLELDLAAFCADPAVTCPSEAWPANVAIDEVDPTVRQDLHTVRAWDADAPGAVVEGLVDHRNDQFLFGLDGDSGGDGSCGALALSLAGGTFWYAEGDDTGDTGDTAGDATDSGNALTGGVAAPGGPSGIVDGQVALGWLGVCAWDGLAVAATLTVATDFDAVRVGDLE